MTLIITKQRVQAPALGSKYIWRALQDRNYSSGPDIARFERSVAELFGFTNAKTVSSGYEALRLAIYCSGKAGGNIAVANYSSCRAMVNAIISTGSKPVYCDINTESLSIDYMSLQKAKERHELDLVIAPSHMGIETNIQALKSLGLPIIEDACQSFHTRLNIKSPAEMMILSFYPTKNFNCISGGVVMFRDEGLRYCREDQTREERERAPYSGGNNFGNMPNLHCAIGLGNLMKVENQMQKLISLKRVYKHHIPHKWLVKEQLREDIVPWRFLVRSHGMFGIEDLRSLGIGSDKEFTKIGSGKRDEEIERLFSIPYYIGMNSCLAKEVAKRFCRMIDEKTDTWGSRFESD